MQDSFPFPATVLQCEPRCSMKALRSVFATSTLAASKIAMAFQKAPLHEQPNSISQIQPCLMHSEPNKCTFYSFRFLRFSRSILEYYTWISLPFHFIMNQSNIRSSKPFLRANEEPMPLLQARHSG